MAGTRTRFLLMAVALCTLVIGVAWADGLRSFVANSPALAEDVNHNFLVVAPPGMIVVMAGSAVSPPDGWLFCDGAAFSGTTYPGLAAVLGATTVPDLRGRVVVGVDTTSVRVSGGLANLPAKTGGVDINTQVPNHLHTILDDTGQPHRIKAACNNSTCGNSTDGFVRGGGTLDTTSFNTIPGNTHNHGGNTGATGTVGGVTNLPPFIAFRYIIKT